MIEESWKTILVIEDDTLTRNLFLECLQAEGYRTIGAENGMVGIDRVQRCLPDLVVCDVAIPEMDGYDVLKIMRQEPVTAIIPFIFLTARKSQSDIRKGMELGADDYLSKPCTATELLKAVAARLERQSVFNYWYATASHQMPSRERNTCDCLVSDSIFPVIPSLKQVFAYIEDNYYRGITLSDVATAVGYSPAYLTNKVGKQTGETVNGWIVKRRMVAARLLLGDTNQTIEQIAMALGYQNPCHFSRQFRQYHGLSPKPWRNQRDDVRFRDTVSI